MGDKIIINVLFGIKKQISRSNDLATIGSGVGGARNQLCV
jgi:hypothetical protein